MDSKFGHKTHISIIIPTRKLNDITLNNIKLLSNYLIANNLLYEIIVISNNDLDRIDAEYTLCASEIKNAAVSRNIGLEKSSIEEGTYIFLDDDIVLEVNKIITMFSSFLKNEKKELFAPYITGHFIKENYKLNWFVQRFYSWAYGSRLVTYNQIQGKSFFSLGFPAILSDSINMVEWIPGGCMIFNNFKKKETYFDLSIFGKSYYMEDFFLSNQLFLKGINIKMIPVIFEHRINYNKFHKNIKIIFKEIFAKESNRIEIQRIRSKFTHESILKYKIVLFSYYLYRLKTFKMENFISLQVMIYICLFNSRK